ncbi:MAG: hypothetical protein ABS48_01330 [Erythrobacter sp. SCN 68-10]|nr:MAG: hypothetical protein ABS48_01330 [Erythrobacter sp. SCN 68-10]
MATSAPAAAATGATDREARFYFLLACAMALVLVGGFSFHLAMGRSSFTAPAIIHFHAVLFMGWLGFYVLQNYLVAGSEVALHRRLGWVAVPWLVALIGVGVATTMNVVQAGRAPFFFLPQHFLFADIAMLLCFAGLTAAALVLRRRTDWHRRLHLCAMAALMGPGFGRALPMPFMGPFNLEIASGLGLVFPLIAVAREARGGRVHAAWAWGLPVIPLGLIAAYVLAHSALGGDLYAATVAGTPGEAMPGLVHGPPPPGM